MTKIGCKLKITGSILLFLFIFSSSSLFFFPLANNNISKGESVENSEELKLSATYWITTEVVSTESTSNSNHATIAVDSAGNLHVVWEDLTNYGGSGTDYDIFYKRWNTISSTWAMTEVVSTESTGNSYFPTIAVDGAGSVHVAWQDLTNYGGSGTDYDIFYKRWNATSSTWTTTEVVSTESTAHSMDSTIAVDVAGNVHVTWEDLTNYGGSGTDYDIFYKRWNFISSTWTTTEVVSTESTSNSFSSTIAVDVAGNVHVAWEDLTNYGGSGADQDTFYKRWNTISSTWTTTEVISTESTSTSSYPMIMVDDAKNAHVVWHDQTDYGGSGTDADIFYKRWNATSSTWTTTEVVSTESTDASVSPTIAVDGAGNTHVAWEDAMNYDGSGTDWDIFYKRMNPLPEIIIYSPDQNTLFRSVAPNFIISVMISILDTMWYSLDDGLTNITFSSLTGTIDQDEWDKQDLGDITIQFYVNDTYGKEGYASVIVRKELFDYYTTWGGINLDEGHSMVIDSSDNMYIVGKTASFTVGGYDIFLVKYDSSGVQEWNRTWGETNNDEGYGIALDSTGNIYVVGVNVVSPGVDNDMVLVKYNSSGVQQWNRTWGGNFDERGYDVAVDSSGNIFVTGLTVSFGPGTCGVFIVKYNSSGSQLWNQTWGGGAIEYGYAIALSTSGNIYLAGSTTSYGPPNTNVFLAKFNSSGDWKWSQFWGGGAIEGAADITVDSQENIYVAGSTSSFTAGGYDTLLIKYNSSGSQQYNRTWGGTLDDTLASIVLDSSNDIYLTGSTGSFGADGLDMLIMKYDNIGNLQWNRTWGGSSNDRGNAILLDSSEDLFVAGYTASYGAGNNDMVLVKFDNNAPKISINSPIQSDFFATSSPSFSIEITELNLFSTWYTLDNGITNIPFSGFTGTIDQTEWDKLGDGVVTIKFYANDTYGFLNQSLVTVFKDTLAPLSLISFIFYKEQDFVNRSTLFTITSDDGSGSSVSVIRYKINNSAWVDYTAPFDLSSYDYGYYLILFQAIDLVNNIETENTLLVRLIEIPTESSEQAVPGYNIFLLIGIICVIYVILIKKHNKNK